jgi:hypothetical protein
MPSPGPRRSAQKEKAGHRAPPSSFSAVSACRLVLLAEPITILLGMIVELVFALVVAHEDFSPPA